MPGTDIQIDEVLGEQRFNGGLTNVGEWEIRETVSTGLFRSIGNGRLLFSDEKSAEYLAAHHLVSRDLPIPKLLRLLLHPDGSGKIVPQLYQLAAWLAALLPDLRSAILSTDPASLMLASAGAPVPEHMYASSLALEVARLVELGRLFHSPERVQALPVNVLGTAMAPFAGRTDLDRTLLLIVFNEHEPFHAKTNAARVVLEHEREAVVEQGRADEARRIQHLESAELVVRYYTWTPFSLSDLTDLVGTKPPRGKDTQEGIELSQASASGQALVATEIRPRTSSLSIRRPVRRNPGNEAIDMALRQIAEAQHKRHRDVFNSLDQRGVNTPASEPFKTAGGWAKGFAKDRQRAAKWLSSNWSRLNLPAFPRGPKK